MSEEEDKEGKKWHFSIEVSKPDPDFKEQQMKKLDGLMEIIADILVEEKIKEITEARESPANSDLLKCDDEVEL